MVIKKKPGYTGYFIVLESKKRDSIEDSAIVEVLSVEITCDLKKILRGSKKNRWGSIYIFFVKNNNYRGQKYLAGKMRGLEKNAPDGANTHKDGHGGSMTESAQWGQFSEKLV